jgi:hypothetical protein
LGDVLEEFELHLTGCDKTRYQFASVHEELAGQHARSTVVEYSVDAPFVSTGIVEISGVTSDYDDSAFDRYS